VDNCLSISTSRPDYIDISISEESADCIVICISDADADIAEAAISSADARTLAEGLIKLADDVTKGES